MTICENCRHRPDKIVLDWYQQECQLIRHLISNVDLMSIIISFLYHLKGHRVFYTKKYRSKPDHLEYDSDSEISGYYENQNVKLCTVCFQKGINHSLLSQEKLPYLRMDIGYFSMTSHKFSEAQIKEIKKKFLKYNFPSCYYCQFYRQTKPQEKEGFLYISSFQNLDG